MSLFAGLISGTSVDAIDAALVDFSPSIPQLIGYEQMSIPADIRDQLLRFNRPASSIRLSRVLELDSALGDCFAEAALHLIKASGVARERIAAIGSHGQTILHLPDGPFPSTLQIADPNRIALKTGITTIADFRRMDMAAGGQGAPLAPAFHAACFRARDKDRAVVNIGGIANVTILPRDERNPILGFDCGPGNALLDEWVQRCSGRRFDENGRWAAQGRPIDSLLNRFLSDPFFQRDVPKSTGRDYFSGAWLDEMLAGSGAEFEPVDVQATLLELTARSIADVCKQLPVRLEQLILCGGGVHNLQLKSRLQAWLPGCELMATSELGISPDAIEAVCFAWLAKRRLDGLPGNIPSVTGASREVLLGAIYASG